MAAASARSRETFEWRQIQIYLVQRSQWTVISLSQLKGVNRESNLPCSGYSQLIIVQKLCPKEVCSILSFLALYFDVFDITPRFILSLNLLCYYLGSVLLCSLEIHI